MCPCSLTHAACPPVCTCVCVWVCVCVCEYVCVRARTRAYEHARLHAHAHARKHTRTNTAHLPSCMFACATITYFFSHQEEFRRQEQARAAEEVPCYCTFPPPTHTHIHTFTPVAPTSVPVVLDTWQASMPRDTPSPLDSSWNMFRDRQWNMFCDRQYRQSPAHVET